MYSIFHTQGSERDQDIVAPLYEHWKAAQSEVEKHTMS